MNTETINTVEDNKMERQIRYFFFNKVSVIYQNYLSPLLVAYLKIKDGSGTSNFCSTNFGKGDDPSLWGRVQNLCSCSDSSEANIF